MQTGDQGIGMKKKSQSYYFEVSEENGEVTVRVKSGAKDVEIIVGIDEVMSGWKSQKRMRRWTIDQKYLDGVKRMQLYALWENEK
jgi:hypothetical protein